MIELDELNAMLASYMDGLGFSNRAVDILDVSGDRNETAITFVDRDDVTWCAIEVAGEIVGIYDVVDLYDND